MTFEILLPKNYFLFLDKMATHSSVKVFLCVNCGQNISHGSCEMGCNRSESSSHEFDTNDRTPLYNSAMKNNSCHCSLTCPKKSKSYAQSQWITFIHILCTVRIYFKFIDLMFNYKYL